MPHQPHRKSPPAASLLASDSEPFHLLDTDTCSYAIRKPSATLDTRLATVKPDSLTLSAVTRAELMFGLEKRGNPRALTRLVHGFLDRVAVMP